MFECVRVGRDKHDALEVRHPISRHAEMDKVQRSDALGSNERGLEVGRMWRKGRLLVVVG